jgi:hypothetical protein
VPQREEASVSRDRALRSDRFLVAVARKLALPCLPSSRTTPSPGLRTPSASHSTSEQPAQTVPSPEPCPPAEALRVWRSKTAHEQGVPPYVVLTNKELHAVVVADCPSLGALARIEGIGKKKIERHGRRILAVHGPPGRGGRTHGARSAPERANAERAHLRVARTRHPAAATATTAILAAPRPHSGGTRFDQPRRIGTPAATTWPQPVDDARHRGRLRP